MIPRLTVLVLALLLASGCAVRHELSPGEEYANALQKSREAVKRYGAVENPEAGRYLRSMASRLSASVPYPPPRNAQYSVTILNTADSLAFSPGSGFILMSRGLILSLKSEDELAFVTAHEIAHQELGHTTVISEPAGEKVEFDADRFAASTIARAGYDSWQALSAIKHAAHNREDLRRMNDASALLDRRAAKLREFLGKSSLRPYSGFPLPQREFLRLREMLR